MPLHRLAPIDKNNKIKQLAIYDNPSVYDEIITNHCALMFLCGGYFIFTAEDAG
jgi:hypothetical protein